MRRGAALIALLLTLAMAVPVFATGVVEPGGGYWNYGAQVDLPVNKHVWSNYYYPTSYHHSTAICGSSNSTGGAPAGYWSYAMAYCNVWDMGYVSFTNN